MYISDLIKNLDCRKNDWSVIKSAINKDNDFIEDFVNLRVIFTYFELFVEKIYLKPLPFDIEYDTGLNTKISKIMMGRISLSYP